MKKERILECTFGELAVYGIKYVSVDSIAAKLHISKKTIYDLFESKENLLLSALKHKIGKIIERISHSTDEQSNVLCGMIGNAVYLFKFLTSLSPVFMEEVELIPAIKEYIYSVKHTLLENGRKRFAEGIADGYLRSDADFDIVGRLLESQIMAMGKGNEKYTTEQICFNSLVIILRGVCTEKGAGLLDEAVEKERGMKKSWYVGN